MMRTDIVEVSARLAQRVGGWKRRKDANLRIHRSHGLAKSRHLLVILAALPFVADLPVFDVIRRRVAVPRAHRSHHSVSWAVKVFDFLRGIARSTVGEADTNQWFGVNPAAELHEFFEPRTGGLQPAP